MSSLNVPSVPLSPLNFSIHGNQTFIDFEFTFFSIPMFLLCLPIVYMPLTIIVILRILVKLIYSVKDKNVNVHLFAAISVAQFMDLLFFICDMFLVRIPATGIVTSWCASVEPNRFINALYTLTFYVNYATMLFPFLVSLMRLILIIHPQNHKMINGTILRVAIPIILIYPFFFTFFMFSAVGFCQTAQYPFPFGGVFINFSQSLFGFKNRFLLLFNTVFWTIACVITNSILIVKLVRLKMSLDQNATHSQKFYKAEMSLTLTTFSMIFAYLSNGMMVIVGIVAPEYTFYVLLLRPFGNDLETVVVSWVFYLTHPVFRRKKIHSVLVSIHNKVVS